jgi:hypothetical protein
VSLLSIFSHCYLLSTGEAAKKDFALFERSEFAKSRQLRGAQGSPKGQQCYSRGEWQGAVSFGNFSLGKQRKSYNPR